MIYQNDTTRIAPFNMKDHMTERYRSWFNDPETTKYNSWGLFPYTPATMRNFVNTIENGDASKIVWAIEVRATKEYAELAQKMKVPMIIENGTFYVHVGNVSLQSINLINRSAELAIILGDGRGKGVGTQACRWVLEHSFQHLGLNRVWTGTAATNEAMMKVCTKIGMVKEGFFTQGMFLDGKLIGVMAYGILADNWRRLR